MTASRSLVRRRAATPGTRDHPGIHHRPPDPPSSVAQRIRIEIGDDAFVAMTPEPLVLFPGAGITCVTDVTLAATGCAILIDGMTHHDPEGEGRPFDRYSNAIVVRNAEGACCFADRGSLPVN